MRRSLCLAALVATAAACSSGGGGGGTPSPTPTPTATPLPASLGKDFLAVDLDNLDPTVSTSFGVTIVNPSATTGAQVTLASTTSGTVATVPVPASSAVAINLAHRRVRGTDVSASAFRITSDVPVAAMQLNPPGDNTDGSTDTSLLLPTAHLGTSYVAMFWPPKNGGSPLPGFLTIAATANGTTVTVTPSVSVDGGGVIPATAAGTPMVFALDALQVVNLEQGGDLSGTLITSDKPVAVFGGSQCGYVDPAAVGCSHLEEELLPTPLVGASYALAKSPQINGGLTSDHWRIIGTADGTTLTADPAQTGMPVALSKGQVGEFVSPDNFTVQANHPVVIGHFYTGATGVTIPTGDSSFTAVPGTENWSREQWVFTPAGFSSNSLTILAPAGATVSLDATPLTAFTAIGGAALYESKIVTVTEGPHVVLSDMPVGVEVSGYDDYVAYATYGGLDIP